MKTTDKPYDGRISDEFHRALTENAAAQALYEAMDEKSREKLRQRAGRARSREELKEIIDSAVGWQTGHPPYQL